MKKIFIIILAVFLAGCQAETFGSVTQRQLEIAGEKVQIGGEPQFGADLEAQKFTPELKMQKWGEETHLKVTAQDEVKDKAVERDGKIIAETKDGTKEYHFYEKTAEEIGNEDGGMEFELILKEKPTTNSFKWDIDLKGLECYYQPPLNEEMASSTCTATDCGGSHRPENIVGSYACYHESKSNNEYKTGKAFHIYRPLITDDAGKEVWGELDITGNVLTVTVPQEFLDKAVYPVICDPTFGYTSAGGSASDSGNAVKARKGNPGESGIVSKLTVWAYSHNNSYAGYTGCLYDSNGDEQTNTNENTPSTYDDFEELDLTYSVGESVTSQDYLIAVIVENLIVGGSIAYDTGGVSGDSQYQNSVTYPNLPSDTSSFGDSSVIYSIYATYTASGTSTDSCTYDTGNWNIQYSDNCHITGTTYVAGDLNINYDAAGSFGLNGTIQCDNFNLGAGAKADLSSGSKIEIY